MIRKPPEKARKRQKAKFWSSCIVALKEFFAVFMGYGIVLCIESGANSKKCVFASSIDGSLHCCHAPGAAFHRMEKLDVFLVMTC
jgi:hypothetical protein